MDRNEEIKSSTIVVNINIILSIIERLDRRKVRKQKTCTAQ